jgi:hypothetical protein
LLFQHHGSPWQIQSTPRMADPHEQFRIVSLLVSGANHNTSAAFSMMSGRSQLATVAVPHMLNLQGAF